MHDLRIHSVSVVVVVSKRTTTYTIASSRLGPKDSNLPDQKANLAYPAYPEIGQVKSHAKRDDPTNQFMPINQ